jgi:multiple sugar transport system permease protein
MRTDKLASYMQKVFSYLLLSLTSVVMMLPFYWMLSTSLKDQNKIFVFPPQWIPSPIVWGNYLEVFNVIQFERYFFNSVYIAVLVTIGTCLIASLAGYAFAKIRFPWRNVMFLMLLSSMMIPGEVTVIPTFLVMAEFGFVNTHIPLIVPSILGAGGIFGVFLMRQFFITIPDDLVEAAKMDGCSPWKTFYKIMLPAATAPMSTLCIFTFLGSWNEFFDPLIYLNSDQLFTLPLGLALFTDQSGTAWHLLMAASMMATLPLLIVFFFAQRKFIEGITLTGLK